MEQGTDSADAGSALLGSGITTSSPQSDELVNSGKVKAKVEINIDILNGMTRVAAENYKECVSKFASALAREASRLEQDDRAIDIEEPEVTATMVLKANDLLRNPRIEPPKLSITMIIAQVIAFSFGILTPIFGSELHSIWQWTVTIACGIIAVAAQTYAIVAAVRRK